MLVLVILFIFLDFGRHGCAVGVALQYCTLGKVKAKWVKLEFGWFPITWEACLGVLRREKNVTCHFWCFTYMSYVILL